MLYLLLQVQVKTCMQSIKYVQLTCKKNYSCITTYFFKYIYIKDKVKNNCQFFHIVGQGVKKTFFSLQS